MGGTGGPGGGGFPSFALADQQREPFKIFDNLYYVGVEFVSSFLLTTSDGLILVDALFGNEGYRDYLLGNVRKVGFDPADIKYLLVNRSPGDPHPFVTPGDFYDWLDELSADAQQALAAPIVGALAKRSRLLSRKG